MNEIPSSKTSSSLSFDSWLMLNGTAEYVEYRKKAKHPLLNYDDWAASEFPLGPYLYRLTLDVWDEATSSDDDPKERVKSASAGQTERPSTKAATANRNGLPHAIHASAPTADTQNEEPGASPKKRRRRKKQSLSAAIISPEDYNDTAASVEEVHASGLDASTKKPKQKKESMPTSRLVSEEAEQPSPIADAPAETDGPDGPNASSAPRRGLRARTAAQQRPYFHHAKLFEGADLEQPRTAARKNPSPQPQPKLARATLYATSGDDGSDEQTAEVEELPIRQSSGPRKFKGPGRAWKKEAEDEDDDYTGKRPKSRGKSRKSKEGQAQVTPPPGTKTEDDEDNRALSEIPATQKRAKPKKGSRRSYLSQELVVDDSGPDETPADDSTLIEEVPPGSQRRQRRPRKSYVSEEFVRDDSESVKADSIQAQDEAKEATPEVDVDDDIEGQVARSSSPQKTKRRSRKFFISEEFVQESSDAEEGEQNGGQSNLVDVENEVDEVVSEPELPTTTTAQQPLEWKQSRKGVRKSRKSHLSEEFVRSDSDSVVGAQEDNHNQLVAATPNKKKGGKAVEDGLLSSSKKSTTPRGRAKKSEAIVLNDDYSDGDNVNVARGVDDGLAVGL